MSNLVTLIKKELLEQNRTKKLLILAVVFLFVAVASPIFAQMTPMILKSISIPGMNLNLPDPTYTDSIDQFIKNVSQIALLVIVFIVAGSVVDEKNKKTLDMVLSKPVSRVTFVLSKFIGYFVSIGLIFFASSLIFYLYTVSIFGGFSFINFLLMAMMVCLYILMIVAVTIFASTIVKNIVVAAGIGFVSFILFGAVASLVEAFKKFSPNYVFSNYQHIVSVGWTNELILPLLSTLLIVMLSVVASIVLFKKQEIER